MKHVHSVSRTVALAQDEELGVILGYVFDGVRAASVAFALIYGTVWGTKNWQNVAQGMIDLIGQDSS